MQNDQLVRVIYQMDLKLDAHRQKYTGVLFSTKDPKFDILRIFISEHISMINNIIVQCDKLANECSKEQLEYLAQARQRFETWKNKVEGTQKRLNKVLDAVQLNNFIKTQRHLFINTKNKPYS